MSPSAAARALIEAYVEDNRSTVEALLASDFTFSSPYDNAINRDDYFSLCWPNHERMQSVEIVRLVEEGRTAAMTYVARFVDGRSARTTEIFIVDDGKVVAIEVYFGWNVPHPVRPGSHDHGD